MLNKIIKTANNILASRYPDAAVMFLAGSLVRGEGTSFSDLDLVIIFKELPSAYRESFYFEDYPIEAFVHDPETLNYFFSEIDRPSGVPSLAQMISEAIEVPAASEFSQSIKRMAAAALKAGPPILSEGDLRRWRYNITNLVDDVREPLSQAELIGAGTELYQALADYYFRANNLWSAQGKAIPRILKKADSELAARYGEAFTALFADGNSGKVIALAEELLKPNGGFLFDGHKGESPENWRKPLV